MRAFRRILIYSALALLAGCASKEPERDFLDSAPIAARQHPVLFPEYFLMDGIELHDHGRIPRTNLIGAGMSSMSDLAEVRTGFNDVLHAHQWETDTMEIGRQSFRIIASQSGETVELRGVQGTSGPVQIFLLYTP